MNWYNCCKCQLVHTEESSLYHDHLRSQSKEGIKYDDRARRLVVIPDKQGAKKYFAFLTSYGIKFKVRPFAGFYGFFFQ
jgi:hypothetical protein